MKKIQFFLIMILLITGCSNQAKKDSTPEIKSDEKIVTRELKTNSGMVFVLTEDKSLGASVSIVKLKTRNFEKSNDEYILGEIDPIEKVFLADLDQNGYEEMYIITRGAGSGSYSNIFGFSSNNDKSVTPIYIPDISANDVVQGGLFYGYQGHNTFTLENGSLINSFPVYLKDDTNANPTGGNRSVKYSMIAGEATWILKPTEIIP